ncbi:multicopper oxidase domain-containing protein [Sporosarcina sp. YIM B06819]|uniref:multicopper oxidase domain-containing protein n=1 Tax=Sporosarcina sp. YIM B06819 TaxID=3081769 RepID=UPI00298C7416|nr:multicopper oxidase domain-containing protein [Sporosarcina sp. YIM B06819]
MLNRDLRPTRLWGYDGTFPGSIVKVMTNKKVYVKWMNDLPSKFFLPINTRFKGPK